MSDGFIYSGPGYARMRSGAKREIVGQMANGSIVVADEHGNLTKRGADGRYKPTIDIDDSCDLVAPWTDPPEPIPAGVWYNAANDSFHGKYSSMTVTSNFWDKWYSRRAEFPQSPPRRAEFPQSPPTPPATPWMQADVPWPCLFRWVKDKTSNLYTPLYSKPTGLAFVFDKCEHDYAWDDLKSSVEWSPNNVDWHPCTREAVAAWRNGGAK